MLVRFSFDLKKTLHFNISSIYSLAQVDYDWSLVWLFFHYYHGFAHYNCLKFLLKYFYLVLHLNKYLLRIRATFCVYIYFKYDDSMLWGKNQYRIILVKKTLMFLRFDHCIKYTEFNLIPVISVYLHKRSKYLKEVLQLRQGLAG